MPITFTNLGPEGGIISSIEIDYSTPTTLYVGTEIGSMFKSTDGGENWVKLETTFSMSRISTLAIDPITQSTIYAGSGRLYKSTDSGENWTEIGLALPYEFGGISYPTIFTLVIDPISPNNLYVGTNEGVFKSTDGGENWREINLGLSSDYVPQVGFQISAHALRRMFVVMSLKG